MHLWWNQSEKKKRKKRNLGGSAVLFLHKDTLAGSLSTEISKLLLDLANLKRLESEVLLKLLVLELQEVGTLNGVLLEGARIKTQTHDQVAHLTDSEGGNVDVDGSLGFLRKAKRLRRRREKEGKKKRKRKRKKKKEKEKIHQFYFLEHFPPRIKWGEASQLAIKEQNSQSNPKKKMGKGEKIK